MTAVVSFNTRFLYSFFFEPDIEKQKEALINASFGKHQAQLPSVCLNLKICVT
jgi:hypothetical protein